MSAREVILQAVGHKDIDFNKTDGVSICKTINEAVYEWAKNITNNDTLNWFKKLGVFGSDIGPDNIFPIR